jgi:hypothetical protein
VAEPQQQAVLSQEALVDLLLQPVVLKTLVGRPQQQVARQAQVVPAAACDTRLNHV